MQNRLPPILQVRGLETGYGEVQVLWGISLTVEAGSIVVLLGPNGAGKTTTLRAISGLLPAWKGQIVFEGRNITCWPPHARVEAGISHVPEGRGIFPDMTVEENLRVAAYPKRARRRLEDRLEIVYTMFPVLRARRKQLAGTLSGGEQQMLAIARAIIQNPKLLLLDEPSLGLAPKLAEQVIEFVYKLNREHGITILLVEQNVPLALRIADYVYVLENGRIVAEGEPDQIKRNRKIVEAYVGI